MAQNPTSKQQHIASGFTAITSPDVRILILGSMPGIKSLEDCEYYAHPRNAFWPIMEALFGIKGDYATRLQDLKSHKIALWDVLKYCERQGSLDSNIKDNSIIANDFENFLNAHPKITHIFFNGTKAETSFNKHVKPDLSNRYLSITYTRLPSTSPAMASLSLQQKAVLWKTVQNAL